MRISNFIELFKKLKIHTASLFNIKLEEMRLNDFQYGLFGYKSC